MAFYKIQFELNNIALRDLQHQADVERRLKDFSALLGEDSDDSALRDRSEKLIRLDLESYGQVRPETVQKVIDMANREIRLKNGLPVD